MLEEILTTYQNDEDKWREWGSKANYDCFEKTKEYIPQELLDLYKQNHGFHDWNIRCLNVSYTCNGKLDILIVIGDENKEISLDFPYCYNFRLGGALCPDDDNIFIKTEVLLFSFARIDDDSFEIGFALSDGSYLLFSSSSFTMKCTMKSTVP